MSISKEKTSPCCRGSYTIRIRYSYSVATPESTTSNIGNILYRSRLLEQKRRASPTKAAQVSVEAAVLNDIKWSSRIDACNCGGTMATERKDALADRVDQLERSGS